MNNMIIVTGGAGFIGCNLVAVLNEKGFDNIMIVDHLGKGEKWKNLQHLRFEHFVHKHEFREMLRGNRVPEAKTVFHIGACSSTTETDADYLADNNYRYTRELCEWSLEHGARFIYASSAATYGDGSNGYSDEDSNTVRLMPLNMYGYSKQMFDLWALKNGLLDRIAGLKYFNVYGPREDHKGDMRSVVHKAFHQVLDKGKVCLFKSYKPDFCDGEQVRDFVYVRDAVRITMFFMEHPDVSGLFNCGTGRARTWVDLARAVFAAMDREPVIEFVEMPEHLREKYQYHTEADTTKLRKAGWTGDFTSLEDGVADYVRGYLIGRGANGVSR